MGKKYIHGELSNLIGQFERTMIHVHVASTISFSSALQLNSRHVIYHEVMPRSVTN